jgi:hypothetical protein
MGLLAVIGFAAIWRDRRRRQAEALVLAPMQSTPTPTGLEDEPIGAIEYQTPGDEA